MYVMLNITLKTDRVSQIKACKKKHIFFQHTKKSQKGTIIIY
jgi:hypothetical protein